MCGLILKKKSWHCLFFDTEHVMRVATSDELRNTRTSHSHRSACWEMRALDQSLTMRQFFILTVSSDGSCCLVTMEENYVNLRTYGLMSHFSRTLYDLSYNPTEDIFDLLPGPASWLVTSVSANPDAFAQRNDPRIALQKVRAFDRALKDYRTLLFVVIFAQSALPVNIHSKKTMIFLSLGYGA